MTGVYSEKRPVFPHCVTEQCRGETEVELVLNPAVYLTNEKLNILQPGTFVKHRTTVRLKQPKCGYMCIKKPLTNNCTICAF